MPAGGLSLELTRLFPAPRARVFEFFAGAALLAEWWRQGAFKTEARRALHRDGWTESFDKLGELV
jgi:uncharacterized protein YndB with AHSA1/START domain